MTNSEAIEVLKANYPDPCFELLRDAVDTAIYALSAQPEIVRCKDCKHRPDGTGANHDLEFPDDRCPCQCEDYWYSWKPDNNWFCGNGERRE